MVEGQEPPIHREVEKHAPRKIRFGKKVREALDATGTWFDTPGGRAVLTVTKLLLAAASIGAGHHMG